MTRTQVLQEIRRMRFEEAYGGWQERRLTQEEAAGCWGVCERTFRRYVDRTRAGAARSAMQTHLILSAIAADEPRGVVSLVRAIHECGCGIREARLVHFGDRVSVAAGVTGNWNAVAKLEDALARLDGEDGLQVVSSRRGPREAPRAPAPVTPPGAGCGSPPWPPTAS